jgi:hypothetical protein
MVSIHQKHDFMIEHFGENDSNLIM